MKPIFIYALSDPRDLKIRYAGQTENPDVRIRAHVNQTSRHSFHNACWIKGLLNIGLRPVMEILDVVPDSEADFWEREYIQNFRERGFDLTNLTDGGIGAKRGRQVSEKTRLLQRAAKLGKKISSQHLANRIGKKRTVDAKRKQSQTLLEHSKDLATFSEYLYRGIL